MNGRKTITDQLLFRVHQLEDPPYERLELMRSQPAISGILTRWSCGKCWSVVHDTGTFRLLSPSCKRHSLLIPEGK